MRRVPETAAPLAGAFREILTPRHRAPAHRLAAQQPIRVTRVELDHERRRQHLIIRVDRAEGFVVHNLTTRGALEHGIYVEETDGYRIDRVKMFWAADYGNLTFTSDHGLYRNCDGFGSGDAVLYPGAAPETGEQADLSFYPDAPRINTTVKKCDMRGSVLAYSGSMGNAVRITKNHVYGNAAGLSRSSRSGWKKVQALRANPINATKSRLHM